MDHGRWDLDIPILSDVNSCHLAPLGRNFSGARRYELCLSHVIIQSQFSLTHRYSSIQSRRRR
ncbi:unnamed protein product [Brassica oleracea]